MGMLKECWNNSMHKKKKTCFQETFATFVKLLESIKKIKQGAQAMLK
jgi:hypothetical protein